MSYVTEETANRVGKLLSPMALILTALIFVTYMSMTVLLVLLQPANMNAELVQYTAVGNTIGVAVLAFIVLMKEWYIDWVTV